MIQTNYVFPLCWNDFVLIENTIPRSIFTNVLHFTVSYQHSKNTEIHNQLVCHFCTKRTQLFLIALIAAGAPKVKMNRISLDISSEQSVPGRKGKTCSMTGCSNTHQRYPNMSFFRFPKELARFVVFLLSYQTAWCNLCSTFAEQRSGWSYANGWI